MRAVVTLDEYTTFDYRLIVAADVKGYLLIIIRVLWRRRNITRRRRLLWQLTELDE